MCYWLGCPMVSDSSEEANKVTVARPSLQETQEAREQITETETVLTDR